MDTLTQSVIFALGGGAGLWLATKIFGSPLHIVLAAAIGVAAALANLIPTVGFAASLIVMFGGVKLATRCDVNEAVISALIARAVIFVLAFAWILVDA